MLIVKSFIKVNVSNGMKRHEVVELYLSHEWERTDLSKTSRTVLDFWRRRVRNFAIDHAKER